MNCPQKEAKITLLENTRFHKIFLNRIHYYKYKDGRITDMRDGFYFYDSKICLMGVDISVVMNDWFCCTITEMLATTVM
jgi:protein subunit release factor A